MKRIKYLLFTLILSIVGVVSVNAAQLSMSVSSKSVTVGSNVKVTVKASGAAGWEYCLNYDSSIFKLTGGDRCVLGGTLAGNQSVTFTLKALKQGKGTFTLGDTSMVNDNADELPVTKGSAVVTVNAQADISNKKNEETLSTNAYLRLLEVVGYNLKPAFKKDVYTYDVEVPTNVEEVGINAFKESNDIGVSITTNVPDVDHIKLAEGVNKVVITVTAPKGNKLNYTVNIKREEESPITVKVDDEDYTVLKSMEGITKPKYYTDSTLEIGDATVPSLTSEATGYTLVALKDKDGNVGLFYYNNGKYEKYIEISKDVLTLIPKVSNNPIKGFEQTKKIDIDSNKITVYYDKDDSDFVLLYAMNVSNGELNWYSYDIKEGTLQRYYEVKTEEKESSGKSIYLYLAIGFAILAGLAIGIVLLLMNMNGRLKKKNDKLVKKLKENKVKVIELEHPEFDEPKEEVISEEVIEEEVIPVETEEEKKDEAKEEEYDDEAFFTREDENLVNEVNDKLDDDDEYDDEAFFTREEDIMVKINEEVKIIDDPLGEAEKKEQERKEKLEKNKIKKEKKEAKKKEKAARKKEEEELKAMRDDFLKTRELKTVKASKKAKSSKTNTKKKK